MKPKPWTAEQLRGIALQERLNHCPAFVADIVHQAVVLLDVERVWIFGSRSRHDAHLTSDYDLAFQVSPQNQPQWSVFSATIQEEAKTLHHLDLVNFAQASDKMQTAITQEGIVIYEKN